MSSVVPWPSHAYVPGQTARHPEGWFDGIKQSAVPGTHAAALAQSDAYSVGAAYLQEGYYWECHEVLEAVWMALPEGADRSLVQGVIQLANARLKLCMGKPRAALRLCEITAYHFENAAGAVPIPGLAMASLTKMLAETRAQSEAQYRPKDAL